MATQADKAAAFASLHRREGIFLTPNPWDAGTARLLARMGFEALATTSAGYAFSIGVPDGFVSRDEMLAHAASIVRSTPLPVSADLENGYADDAASVGETIRLAAETGLAGASIEDVSARPNARIYELEHAADRIRAAAEAARSLPHPFVLTARAENFITGRPDLADTIRRLQAFQEAGADALFAPGLASLDDIRTVVGSVDRPVNVIAGMPGATWNLADLQAAGVRRVSIGSGLARAAFGAFLTAAREMHEHGAWDFAKDAISYRDLTAMFDGKR
ncbi:MAG: isocitrate lyase/phosphoenolpyruvate mutase family protein [Bryobacteraceae bacterium]